MEAPEFVNLLKSIPSKEAINSYRSKGLDGDFIMEYLDSFNFKEYDESKVYGDPILDLVNNYDGSTVVIGMITFDIEPEEDDNYYVFGRFEADFLAINKSLKIVEVLEYGTNGHVIYQCARNSSSFLNAIIEAAGYMGKCVSDSNLRKDKSILNLVIERCGDLAGGDDYIDFYKMMLGFDD